MFVHVSTPLEKAVQNGPIDLFVSRRSSQDRARDAVSASGSQRHCSSTQRCSRRNYVVDNENAGRNPSFRCEVDSGFPLDERSSCLRWTRLTDEQAPASEMEAEGQRSRQQFGLVVTA